MRLSAVGVPTKVPISLASHALSSTTMASCVDMSSEVQDIYKQHVAIYDTCSNSCDCYEQVVALATGIHAYGSIPQCLVNYDNGTTVPLSRDMKIDYDTCWEEVAGIINIGYDENLLDCSDSSTSVQAIYDQLVNIEQTCQVPCHCQDQLHQMGMAIHAHGSIPRCNVVFRNGSRVLLRQDLKQYLNGCWGDLAYIIENGEKQNSDDCMEQSNEVKGIYQQHLNIYHGCPRPCECWSQLQKLATAIHLFGLIPKCNVVYEDDSRAPLIEDMKRDYEECWDDVMDIIEHGPVVTTISAPAPTPVLPTQNPTTLPPKTRDCETVLPGELYSSLLDPKCGSSDFCSCKEEMEMIARGFLNIGGVPQCVITDTKLNDYINGKYGACKADFDSIVSGRESPTTPVTARATLNRVALLTWVCISLLMAILHSNQV